MREIREGIDDTGVKAAFLKCAVEQHGIIGDIPRILAAIAEVSVETGAPVMVHTNAPARTGLIALEALTDAGVDPKRIVIAHAGDSNDLDYLRAIADTGASLGCDRFKVDHFNPDARRIETLAALVAEGYTSSVHLGHDGACFYDFMFQNPFFADEKPDYLHISHEDRARAAGRRRDAGPGRRDVPRQPAALLHAFGLIAPPTLNGPGRASSHSRPWHMGHSGTIPKVTTPYPQPRQR